MPVIRNDDEERLARIEHVLERLRNKEHELTRITEEIRVAAENARTMLARAQQDLNDQISRVQEHKAIRPAKSPKP